jgi:malonyl-CoA/methylmalonyl-CoA synthetase
MNLAQRLAWKAKEWSGKPAVIFEGTVYTYGEIDSLVERYCGVLARLGVGIGDRVAIQIPKRMDFIFLELAILSVGGVALPLNSDYTAEEVEYFLSDSGSSLFFTDSARFAKARQALGNLPGLRIVVVDSAGERDAISLPDELERVSATYDRTYPTGDDDTAIICYTSGTTGRSKGALITHKNLVTNMMALHETWQWSDRDKLLHVLPLFHVHGLFVALHGGLNAGAVIVMHEKFDPVRTWRTIEEDRCTILMGVPTMYQRLMNAWTESERPPDLSSMRLFVSGSAPLLETLFNRFAARTGFRILERYGMTETGMIASNSLEPEGRKAKSVGYPLPGVEIRIAGASGEDVPMGEVGEVLIRGDNVFKGYWAMPKKTEESFVDGWFRSGDLGYRDPEDGGRLYLVGREKELIITGGYNVYPKEVENLLESHEAVRESAVIGLPDEDFGERVTAVVALESEDSSATPESLVEFCRKHLASYKCPKQVIVVRSLPRNSMGKLQKGKLVEQFRPT